MHCHYANDFAKGTGGRFIRESFIQIPESLSRVSEGIRMAYYFSLGWNQVDLAMILTTVDSFKNLQWFVTDVSLLKIRSLKKSLFDKIETVYEVANCRLQGSHNSRVTKLIQFKAGEKIPEPTNFKVHLLYVVCIYVCIYVCMSVCMYLSIYVSMYIYLFSVIYLQTITF